MRKSLLLAVTISINLLFPCGYTWSKNIYVPEPPGKVTVEGDVLFLNDALYAELRYFERGEDGGASGAAVYYFPCDKEEWIFPKEGWSYYVVPENKKYGTIAEMEQLKQEAKQKGYTTRGEILGLEFPHSPQIVEGFDPTKIVCMRGERKFRKGKKRPGVGVYNVRLSEDGKFVLYDLKSANEEHGKEKCYRVKYGEAFETSPQSKESKCLRKERYPK